MEEPTSEVRHLTDQISDVSPLTCRMASGWVVELAACERALPIAAAEPAACAAVPKPR